MLPQENLKFSALKMPFSCILIAPQAIQTHKQPHPPERHNSVLTVVANDSIAYSHVILVCLVVLSDKPE